jgi:HSP20 family protein
MVIEAHLPNFDEKDVEVHVEDGTLIIHAENHEKEEDRDKKYVVRESSNSFYRRIVLPERAVEENIAAHMDGGILKVTVPLRELTAPKKIAIKGKKK